MQKRKNLRIINFAFEFLGEVDNYEDFILTRKFNTYGDFSFKISAAKNIRGLSLGNIVFLDNERAGVITKINREFNQEQDILTVEGKALEYLLSYRLVEPPSNLPLFTMTSNVKNIIKSLLESNLGLEASSNRQIPEILIASSLGRGEEITYTAEKRWENLGIEIQNICLKGEMGIRSYLDFEHQKIVFDVLVGRNITSTQSLLPPVIFKKEFGNILRESYFEDMEEEKSMAVMGGQGNDQYQLVAYVNDNLVGLERKEIFIEDGSLGNQTALIDKGEEELLNYKTKYSLDAGVNPFHSFKYGVDFLLGDIVSLKSADKVMHKRIIEVSESFNQDGYNLECLFGDDISDLISKLK